MDKKRLGYVDVGKGIATILVILGHTFLTPKTIVNSLYSYHIPLFFFLSGFVLSVKKYPTFCSFLKNKSLKILIPYFMLSLIIWIFVAIIKQSHPFENAYTLNSFVGIFVCAKDTPYYLTLWFVISLYISQLLLFFPLKKDNQKLLIMGMGVCFIVAIIVSIVYEPGWPFALDTIPIATFFIISGYLARKNLIRLEKLLKLYFFPLAFGFNCLFGLWNFKQFGRSDLFYQNIGNPIFYLIAAFSGIWMILIISRLFENSKVLNYIGKNSLIYYAFHRPFMFPIALKIIDVMKHIDFILFRNKYGILLCFMLIVCTGVFVLTEIINRFFPFVVAQKYIKK